MNWFYFFKAFHEKKKLFFVKLNLPAKIEFTKDKSSLELPAGTRNLIITS